jgi:ankyrin repeat protein
METRRKNIPIDLFTKILGKTTNVNAQDEFERTALHWVMMDKYESAVKELLKRKDVDVNVKDRNNYTAFDYCRAWKNIPLYLFIIIKDKATADIQAQNEDT